MAAQNFHEMRNLFVSLVKDEPRLIQRELTERIIKSKNDPLVLINTNDLLILPVLQRLGIVNDDPNEQDCIEYWPSFGAMLHVEKYYQGGEYMGRILYNGVARCPMGMGCDSQTQLCPCDKIWKAIT